MSTGLHMVKQGIAVAYLALGLMAGSVFGQDTAALRDGMNAAYRGDWVKVDAAGAGLSDAISRDILDWMRLRGRQGTFGQCRDFMARNSDWPGLPLLMRSCEAKIARGGAPAPVLEFFAYNAPQTGTGSLRYAEALIKSDRGRAAADELRRAWTGFTMSRGEHDAFVDRNGRTIADLHEARLDMLLWRGQERAARRMFPLVSAGWRTLAEARIGLRNQAGNVDSLIAAVPAALADDPGMAFERFLWRARKGRDASAIELLLARSVSATSLGEPGEWANRRRSLAREMMRDGKSRLAYSIAASHHLSSGSDFADLEWLSGYLALVKLDDPLTALDHFSRFEGAVETPISLGRAGYWQGRAHEAAGDAEAAKAAYAFGARYQSSFYGQLAAERGGIAADPRLAGTETFPDWQQSKLAQSSVFVAALQLREAGQRNLAERFLTHLGESQDRAGLGQLADVALGWRDAHIALMISKRAARQGHEIYKSYFPLGLPDNLRLPVETEFALAIARRESEFDPVVISSAGARGLMQLMPGTAREVARQRGETYSQSRLLSDPAYNARLGTAYLAGLAKRYRNNPVLMSVGYNAGPRRANQWSARFGDPRSNTVDVVDWIEHIPFRETRNYVMRVTESFAPYRARLSGKVDPIRLMEDLTR